MTTDDGRRRQRRTDHGRRGVRGVIWVSGIGNGDRLGGVLVVVGGEERGVWGQLVWVRGVFGDAGVRVARIRESWGDLYISNERNNISKALRTCLHKC
jgi:hypothetical protein